MKFSATSLKLLSFLTMDLLIRSTSVGIAILESSCTMKIKSNEGKEMSLETIATVETETAAYLLERLKALEKEGMILDESPLMLYVAVKKRESSNSANSTSTNLWSTVSLVYNSAYSNPIQLETVLNLAVAKDTTEKQFSFSQGAHDVSFESLYNNATVLRVIDASLFGDNSPDFALILATIILSVMLVVVSSILLYISGGWDACKVRCTNCLFEEVEDEFIISNKNSLPTNGQRTYEEDEENSVATSPAPTNASGVLGAHNQINHMASLGIKTPARHENGSMMTYDYDDGMTPMSQATNSLPLGITSMRKMPQPETPEAQRGLTGIIMQRFASNSTRKL